MGLSAKEIAETAGWLVAGTVAALFGIQKMLKNWKDTSTESNVMKMMHEELERMAKHNKVLSEELSSLQLEIVKLNKELRRLSDENQKLHSEIKSLNAEITRLQLMLESREQD